MRPPISFRFRSFISVDRFGSRLDFRALDGLARRDPSTTRIAIHAQHSRARSARPRETRDAELSRSILELRNPDDARFLNEGI